MNSISRTILVSLAILLSLSVSAFALPAGYSTSSSDPTLSIISDTWLQWLSPVESKRMPYSEIKDDVLYNGIESRFYGYRRATDQEFSVLLSDYGIDSTAFLWQSFYVSDPQHYNYYSLLDDLSHTRADQSWVGGGHDEVYERGLYGYLYDQNTNKFREAGVGEQLWLKTNYTPDLVYDHKHMAGVSSSSIVIDDSTNHMFFGHWMVRNLPNIIISPTIYGFGNVNIGNTSTPQTFTITNTGSADLIIGFDNISLTAADASEFYVSNDNCSSQIIAPSYTCTIDVTFSPTTEGAKSAKLSIPSNDPDTPVLNVQLSGTGIDPDNVDDDGDGYSENQGDCNDNDDTVNPSATDIPYNGMDEDCNGADLIAIDIDPKHCPNKLKIKDDEGSSDDDSSGGRKGDLKVAIPGTQGFDVNTIDITTLNINGVAPVKTKIKDVTAPLAVEPCECEVLKKDNIDDLELKFNSQAIIATLGTVQNGDVIPVTLTGNLLGGAAIEGKDCVLIEIK